MAGYIPSETSFLDVKTLPSISPGATGRTPLACWRGRGLEEDRRRRAKLREVLAIPSKGSGQQPWKLRPPHVLRVGRRWLQAKGGSHLQALSCPGVSAPQGPGQGTRRAHDMSQMHSVGKAARAFGWGQGCQGSQRGLSVASCSGRYIPQKKQQCWERQR